MAKVHRLKPIVPGHPFYKGKHIPYYYAAFPLVRHYFYKRLDNVMSHLISTSTKNGQGIALDVGCFVGLVTMSLLDTYEMAIGVDIDLEYLKMAKQLCEYEGKHPAHFVLADVNHLPFKSDTFSAVTGASIFEHLPDIPDPFNEIKRLLKQDGVFVAGLPIEVGASFFIKQTFFRLINWSRQDRISFSEALASFSYGEKHGPKWNSDHLDYNWRRTLSFIRSRFDVEQLLFWPFNFLKGLLSVYVSISAINPHPTISEQKPSHD